MIQEFADFSHKMTACFGDFSEFERKIRQIAEIAQIDLSQLEIDHLAVRMNSIEKAEQWRAFLLTQGKLLKQSEVNGRPIALITLHQPLQFCKKSVSIIELPFPKGKIYPQEGWEHIEVVFPMLKNENVEEWIARTLSHFRLQNNAQLNLKISQPQAENEQLPNPTIAITLNSATYANFYCLKLHPYGINTVIHS